MEEQPNIDSHPLPDPALPVKRGRGRPRGSKNGKQGPRNALAFSRDEVELIVRLRNHAHESAMAARAAAQVAFDVSLALGSALRRFKSIPPAPVESEAPADADRSPCCVEGQQEPARAAAAQEGYFPVVSKAALPSKGEH